MFFVAAWFGREWVLDSWGVRKVEGYLFDLSLAFSHHLAFPKLSTTWFASQPFLSLLLFTHSISILSHQVKQCDPHCEILSILWTGKRSYFNLHIVTRFLAFRRGVFWVHLQTIYTLIFDILTFLSKYFTHLRWRIDFAFTAGTSLIMFPCFSIKFDI